MATGTSFRKDSRNVACIGKLGCNHIVSAIGKNKEYPDCQDEGCPRNMHYTEAMIVAQLQGYCILIILRTWGSLSTSKARL